jgi:hypothetical protein
MKRPLEKVETKSKASGPRVYYRSQMLGSKEIWVFLLGDG